MSSDPHRIETPEQLREVLGEPSELVREKIFDHVDPVARDFIAASPLVLLATCDARGNMDVSPKGDQPGFVRVLDDRTLAIPDRTGNKLADGHINILESPRVGLIFLIPGVRETYRVNGHAELTRDPALLETLVARGKPAMLATRIFVEEAFFHCGKALIRSSLWKAETWPKDFKTHLGRQMARKMNAPDEAAEAIDEALERDYIDHI